MRHDRSKKGRRIAAATATVLTLAALAIFAWNLMKAWGAEEHLDSELAGSVVALGKSAYRGRVPLGLTILRVVATSVDRVGDRSFLILFDDYRWYGKQEGYVLYEVGQGVTQGGVNPRREELANLRGRYAPLSPSPRATELP